MTCQACTASEANPHHGLSFEECLGCQARRLAKSPMAFRARAGDADDLKHAIAEIWKDDYLAGRAAVWSWMERIRAGP